MTDKQQHRGWQRLTNGWVTFKSAYSPWQMLTIQIKYKWGQQSLDITFLRTIAFCSNFHSLGPCIYYMDFYHWGFMHSCMFKNTTCHECFNIFISLYFKANFIRLSFHSRMFKKTTSHEWDFHKIFISKYIVLMAVLLVLGLSNTTQVTQSWDTNKQGSFSNQNALVGKGPPCHKSNSRSG